MKAFKLIISQAASATYNMGLDEKIFLRFLEDRIPVLRLYRWEKPSFTYGVSQNPESEIDLKQCSLDGVEVVKRITGGGILFHHDEITYSFVCDKADVGEPEGVFVSYKEICAFLINFYESLGLKASFALKSESFKHKSAPSELCSNSYEKYDILINGKKIGGNAQKRKRQVIFQHGSIPISIDWDFVGKYLKNLPKDISLGVTSLSEELVALPDKNILGQKLVDSFARIFNVEFIKEDEFLIKPAGDGQAEGLAARNVSEDGEVARPAGPAGSTKPEWLNKRINLGACADVKELLRDLQVETVCEQALCPNMGECFERNEATFLILGRNCTRMCSFCNVEKASPSSVDLDEPRRVAEAVERLSLKHVVITSVTRDDLPDGGAEIFRDTVLSIRNRSPKTTIEILIPDFRLSLGALTIAATSGADIIAHNVETVPSLYNEVRQGADYQRSLEVLKIIKKISPSIKTKSGLMLGLGETKDEVCTVMKDLRLADCDFLSIGQYLAPSTRHYPVKEYVSPQKFDNYKKKGEDLGFLHIKSAPYVRSSYAAAEYL